MRDTNRQLGSNDRVQKFFWRGWLLIVFQMPEPGYMVWASHDRYGAATIFATPALIHPCRWSVAEAARAIMYELRLYGVD